MISFDVLQAQFHNFLDCETFLFKVAGSIADDLVQVFWPQNTFFAVCSLGYNCKEKNKLNV